MHDGRVLSQNFSLGEKCWRMHAHCTLPIHVTFHKHFAKKCTLIIKYETFWGKVELFFWGGGEGQLPSPPHTHTHCTLRALRLIERS